MGFSESHFKQENAK